MSFSSKTEGSKLVLNNIIKTCEHCLSLELINLFPSSGQEGGGESYSYTLGKPFCDSKTIGAMPH